MSVLAKALVLAVGMASVAPVAAQQRYLNADVDTEATKGPAAAQRWYLKTGVDADVTQTSNANYGLSAEAQADTILTARPYVNLRAEGGRLRVIGFAALEAQKYVHGSQTDRLLPQADLSARMVAIERLFFIDAGLSAGQTTIDPFGPRPGGGSNANTLTTTQWRLSPSIEGTAGPDLQYLLRSNNAWTNERGTDVPDGVAGANSYFGNHLIQVGRDPHPFGWRLNVERNETRYDNSNALQQAAVSDAARVEVNYAIGPDLSAGVRGGVERNNYTVVSDTQNLVGIQARWKPSVRTDLFGNWEDRYFGSSWRLEFNHRMPFLAWNLLSSRDVTTTPQELFELPASNNVTSLLDAMFTTRFPDPISRAKEVQDFIGRQGLPTSTLAPVTLYGSRISVVTRNVVTAAWTGTRSTVSFSAFRITTEDLPNSDFALGTADVNNIERGISIGLGHSMTPTTGLSARAFWSHITALEGFGDSNTREYEVSARVNHRLAPRTLAYGGLRARRIESNVSTSGREMAAFVGLNQAF